MKLLVCDIEGTIFKPHKIKSSQHASYIWTAIAEKLGKEAEKEEINTQKKWKNGGYGYEDKGQAYIDWVNDSIAIHKKYKLKKEVFDELIEKAPYVDGVFKFFKNLNRNEYIPIFISGGIQNLSEKACRDLGVEEENSYASCKYYFDRNGEIDEKLTFFNTSNFYGKQELVKIALRKYGLSETDWVFIGDGINDVSVAKHAPLSIGISPVDELKAVVNKSFEDFEELLKCQELVEEYNFISTNHSIDINSHKPVQIIENSEINASISFVKNNIKLKVEKNIGNLNIPNLENRAWKRIQRTMSEISSSKLKSKLFGIVSLLEAGELSFALLTDIARENDIVSATLQPFCNATETMIYVCFVLTGSKEAIAALESSIKSSERRNTALSKLIKEFGNNNLSAVLHEYLHNRNLAAHTYQSIPITAARSFIQRTYESIQRMELIINSFETNNISNI